MKTNKYANLVKFGLSQRTLMTLSESEIDKLHKNLIESKKETKEQVTQPTTRSGKLRRETPMLPVRARDEWTPTIPMRCIRTIPNPSGYPPKTQQLRLPKCGAVPGGQQAVEFAGSGVHRTSAACHRRAAVPPSSSSPAAAARRRRHI